VRAGNLVIAAIVATIAFWTYTQTLLPGVDLGDTGGFQAAVLWQGASARQAYPLYYRLGRPFVRELAATNPARGLNLFSAVWGAVAAGLLTWLAATLASSALAGAAAGLLLAFSYTFWTQAIIAEVYTLHLALVSLCLIALHAFASRPTRTRLAAFFAVYALSFGNHLSMVLLLVPFTVFLLQTHPSRRELFRPAVIALAVLIAIAGALQYTPNLMWVWSSIDAPARVADRFAAFWFDTTKADWREEMVLGINGSQAGHRLAMWVWDARQQFGIAGLTLAAIGAARLWTIARPWAVLVWLSYAICTTFAITYNVGDTHVFFLTSHYLTALAAGLAVAPLRRSPGPLRGTRPTSRLRGTGPTSAEPAVGRVPAKAESPDLRGTGPTSAEPAVGRVPPEADPPGQAPNALPPGAGARHLLWSRAITIAALAVLAYAGWRTWDTWPAVDRHADRRGEALVARLAYGVNERNALILSEMDWQSENALLYSSRWERTDLAWTRLAAVLPHLPFLVRDNQDAGRDIVLTAQAAAHVVAAYGSLFPLAADDAVPAPSLAATAAAIPRGMPYVLTLLTPVADERFDPADFEQALSALTGGHPPHRIPGAYEAIAGLTGEAATFYRSDMAPFRSAFSLLGDPFTIRMESWLPMDTFRRAGFGHVIRGRDHVLIVERGASLVWFDSSGSPSTTYAGGLYAPRPRYRISAATSHLASTGQNGRPEGGPSESRARGADVANHP
jgi:hypothetical protein